MTDQTIPPRPTLADMTDEDRRLARDWAAHIIRTPRTSLPMEAAAARVILHAVPAPKRPTLADMTYQERAACQRMQCDVIGFRGKYILVSPSDWDGDAVLLGREGEVHYEDLAMVVPRPDLPRLEWPGDTPAPESTLAVGSVWSDINALTEACEESGRDQIIVSGYDGYAFIWDVIAEWWEGSTPPRAAPFTILHAGHETDW